MCTDTYTYTHTALFNVYYVMTSLVVRDYTHVEYLDEDKNDKVMRSIV